MPTTMNPQFSNPNAIAGAGEEIYKTLRAELEASQHGKFVAISIESKAYYIGDSPEEALEKAKAAEPQGIFHLVRVGFPGAFRISHAIQKSPSNWLFQ
jgi:hypothetical protein